jgi:hypothetical protein
VAVYQNVGNEHDGECGGEPSMTLKRFLRALVVTVGLTYAASALAVEYVPGVSAALRSLTDCLSVSGSVVTTGCNVVPSANDGAALGTTALSFSDLFLASGGTINFGNGNAVITHVPNGIVDVADTLRIRNPLTPAGNNIYDIGVNASSAFRTGYFGTSVEVGTTVVLAGVAFASLGTPANGAIRYCSDCTIASPCASGGTGALAKRLNGAWVCN